MVDKSKYDSHSLHPGPPCSITTVNTVAYLYSSQLLKSGSNLITDSTYAAPATKSFTILALKIPDMIAIKTLVATPIIMTLDVILAKELHTITGMIMNIMMKGPRLFVRGESGLMLTGCIRFDQSIC